MGSAISLAAKRRPERHEDSVAVISYTSLATSNHPDFRRRRTASGIPLARIQFSRLAALCPLPGKIFTPFPPCDQAVGGIVKCFPAMPPALCYRRFVSKHPPDRLCHRIDCAFLPHDEGSLLVCSGLYLLRPQLVALRINGLYDGLVAQWSFNSEGGGDHCAVIRGSRSNNVADLAMTRMGRFLAWPSNSGVVVFDRYAATACRRETFFVGDSVRAVDFAPDRRHLAVVSSFDRHFLLRVMLNFDAAPAPFQVTQETDLTRIDPSLYMRVRYNDLVSVKFSPSGDSIAVGTKDGHFQVISTQQPGFPIFLLPATFRRLGERRHIAQTYLAGHKAFDFAPAGDRLALATASGEVVLCCLSVSSTEHEFTRSQLIPLGEEEERRINCLRFARSEPWLAAGVSSGEVLLLHRDSLQLLVTLPLEPADFGPPFAPCVNDAHGFTSLCFSFSDSYLAAGATDGFVRVWCVKRPTGPLTDLCRRRIRGLCTKAQVRELPVHPVMHDFLNESLAHRTSAWGCE